MLRKNWLHNWQPRGLKQALALQQRIEALKHRFYVGCGFHYSLVSDIEKTISMLQTEGFAEQDWMDQMVVKVRLETATNCVLRAEKSADEIEIEKEKEKEKEKEGVKC